ncbi:MAG: DUF87 domain-containing protein, partial [Tissierellia bacterium]|nr:DUF87 domain-containing protein [Tissierellia bacterium]
MLGKIVEIFEDKVKIKMSIDIKLQPSLSNLHVVFEEDGKKVVGEIDAIDEEYLNIIIIGEIIANMYFPGVTKKPSFKADVRVINMDELVLILGPSTPSNGTFYLGESSIYNNYAINVGINNFFSNHFAIIGNSGSGKSCATATIFQNLFYSNNIPVNSNIFVFDAYGEYHNAFAGFNQINPNICYKNITTNPNATDDEQLRVPLWLLGAEGIAMLLDVDDPKQIHIIEKTLNLLPILSRNDASVVAYKNNIIARCLRDIVLTGKSASQVRNQIMSVLTYYNTNDLNLDLKIVEPGYTRTLKQCLYVDDNDSMLSIEKVVGAITQFISDDLDYKNAEPVPFTLEDFDKALSFALISEGILKSDKVYDYANLLAVRTNSLIEGRYSVYFDCHEYVTENGYIHNLMTTSDGRKAQIVNFNINYIDDRFAKVLVKLLSKAIFNISANSLNRASSAYHIIIEEAHIYVKNDTDTKLFGYNIFDRIAKEGRKYGVLLGFVTQRPSEISETSISQCSNFLIFRTMHARDLNYLETMMPNATTDTMDIIKTLQPGTCMTFGSAFKIPISVKLQMP